MTPHLHRFQPAYELHPVIDGREKCLEEECKFQLKDIENLFKNNKALFDMHTRSHVVPQNYSNCMFCFAELTPL